VSITASHRAAAAARVAARVAEPAGVGERGRALRRLGGAELDDLAGARGGRPGVSREREQ
jgi:hypothetical protein